MFSTPEELVAYVKDDDVEFVDVRFCDLPGIMQHFNVPAESFDEESFADGLAFDGSSIRGFQPIHESDMLLLPDVTTAFIDPFRARRRSPCNFFIHDPFTREAYSRDPRNVARKAETYLASSGIADTAYFGAEAEFYIFDSSTSRPSMNGRLLLHRLRSRAGGTPAATRRAATAATRPRTRAATSRSRRSTTTPTCATPWRAPDQHAGFNVERSHHEVGTAGQAEINYKFSTLLHAGDQLQLFKYIIKNTAWQHGKTATFMPKPLFGDNGSGMHTHQSLWLGGEPLFYDETGYGGLSDIARWYIGGLLHHAPSLLAFTNPTVNSYRRLVPGYEAPVNLVYSQRNRSACTRIPVTGTNAKAKRIEFRCPDPSANPYLAFSAMLMAGLDGIKNKIEPPAPIDKDLYDLPPDEAANVQQVPGSLAGRARPRWSRTTTTCSRAASSPRT